jgi:hypothetical protein
MSFIQTIRTTQIVRLDTNVFFYSDCDRNENQKTCVCCRWIHRTLRPDKTPAVSKTGSVECGQRGAALCGLTLLRL